MKKSVQVIGWAAIILLAVLPSPAADSAVLRNGFSIRHQHRQVLGTITRLYLDGDNASFVDVPTEEIDHFEALPLDAAPRAAARVAPKTLPASQAQGLNVEQPLDLNDVIATASGTYRLDPDLINSVIRAESGFNVRAVSPKGARGLMQLMPQTAAQMGVQNVFDPRANVEGGTRYLRELLERYDFDLIKALAAYNAGPQRVEQYGGVPPYYETRAYVARIVRDFNKKKLAAKSASQPATQKSSTKPAAPHASEPTARKSASQTQTKESSAQATR